ncbi:MAG: Protein with Tau-Like repeats family member (ptl-1) [bacterium F082]|nr:MAG: Protein with Tau-Like repeats family member (ptl-1) [bacterium F082]KWW30893.1 MAG: Protein with Tau-Like repeats family member (ptl-1) [bacterium P201]
MNDTFESQKEQLVSIKQEISLLYQQINYLLRNEKPLELLDLDVLMNRTHTLYDMLCSVNVGAVADDEDLPFDADDIAGLFGGMTQEEQPEAEPEPELEPEPEPEPEPALEPVVEPTPEPVVEPEPVVAPTPVFEAPALQPEPEVAPVEEERPLGDDFGVFLRFEEVPEPEPEAKVETVEKDGKVVHVMEEIPEEDIPERDRVHGEDLVTDNPLVMPRMDDERMAEREEIERQSSDGMSGFFGQDDASFELSLGESMMGEDHSLAAKLQQAPGRDLKSVIGINDKFLFVNELFGGSMEKYNKSIENLNDLKTLNGAMIYLNELKIELQWNSSNEAYQKLKDLVSHKFE